MAVNVQAELESQLAAINDKLAGLQELQTQKARIEATLALLKGEISLDNFRPAGKKANAGGTGRPMTELHKSKIALSRLRKKLEENPKDAELKRKVVDLTALISSLEHKK
ncbi:MAG: hypothetical protein WA532_11465 [Candidatus Korobacteraceae bacterium]